MSVSKQCTRGYIVVKASVAQSKVIRLESIRVIPFFIIQTKFSGPVPLFMGLLPLQIILDLWEHFRFNITPLLNPKHEAIAIVLRD